MELLGREAHTIQPIELHSNCTPLTIELHSVEEPVVAPVIRHEKFVVAVYRVWVIVQDNWSVKDT